MKFPEDDDRKNLFMEHSDDSSDEEVLIRTGNIPKHWYDNYDHVGYTVKGEKVGRSKKNDEIEEFLRK
jgi:ribosome biogenesis protein ERB1